ncbi:MAG: hypothetical protein VKJ46_12425 [Leptolyngbyaceae bacterium]|nr:hypothetical protein [Leptolyngbyaceae bacterium]
MGNVSLLLAGLLGVYVAGYGMARIHIFHAVEHYPEGKGGPRRDYIAKKDLQAGEGWEYHFFLPVIKLEEVITRYL